MPSRQVRRRPQDPTAVRPPPPVAARPPPAIADSDAARRFVAPSQPVRIDREVGACLRSAAGAASESASGLRPVHMVARNLRGCRIACGLFCTVLIWNFNEMWGAAAVRGDWCVRAPLRRHCHYPASRAARGDQAADAGGRERSRGSSKASPFVPRQRRRRRRPRPSTRQRARRLPCRRFSSDVAHFRPCRAFSGSFASGAGRVP